MTICMNMSRFINLAAIFSLDLESQFTRRLEYDPVGLILATIRVLGSDLVGRILAVISAKRDFCNSRFHCVHCSALLPLNITKFLQKKM